jgi:hypothetical protein
MDRPGQGGVDDDAGRPLTVDYNYLLMTGDGFRVRRGMRTADHRPPLPPDRL